MRGRPETEKPPEEDWHEPYESRGSRMDLWGTVGESPPVYPAEKAQQRLCQVGIKETSASEPLMRCRKSKDGVKTGGYLYPRISSGESC